SARPRTPRAKSASPQKSAPSGGSSSRSATKPRECSTARRSPPLRHWSSIDPVPPVLPVQSVLRTLSTLLSLLLLLLTTSSSTVAYVLEDSCSALFVRRFLLH